mmetsp:Transcript_31705/g.52940  ORF Transcript_31705/g.52940 Transcript_31705/m.52940 type:complete len:430 (-) Transcript_31705:167-1456(-)|eukprot:CAMPEP_0178824890 /NCGR_PEP_ID=MMETSP0746-20121128/5922_1 /TAXON_ID=913974 /ORGANISM="Nitzschia punctata, Strain CCMP561" /LENGTH=429 /DNA_ID=CAMNT_0020486603 /DNA_START=68 /DNA_END=1357 /DNA_ORIENTATION=-
MDKTQNALLVDDLMVNNEQTNKQNKDSNRMFYMYENSYSSEEEDSNDDKVDECFDNEFEVGYGYNDYRNYMNSNCNDDREQPTMSTSRLSEEAERHILEAIDAHRKTMSTLQQQRQNSRNHRCHSLSGVLVLLILVILVGVVLTVLYVNGTTTSKTEGLLLGVQETMPPSFQETTNATTPPTSANTTDSSSSQQTTYYAAQYLAYFQHVIDYVQTVDRIPGGLPKVRYMCKGTFQLIGSHQNITDNPLLQCQDVSDDDGFSGIECTHDCGPDVSDCGYWWNTGNRENTQGWNRAGFWYRCFGETLSDVQARFTWEGDNQVVGIHLPVGSATATNMKIARLAVRSDYTETDQELIDNQLFPTVDVTANYMSPHSLNRPEIHLLNDAIDGGYYVWTGTLRCVGGCFVQFGSIVIDSNPERFPDTFLTVNKK